MSVEPTSSSPQTDPVSGLDQMRKRETDYIEGLAMCDLVLSPNVEASNDQISEATAMKARLDAKLIKVRAKIKAKFEEPSQPAPEAADNIEIDISEFVGPGPLRHSIRERVDKLKLASEDEKLYHLHGFWEQLQDPDRIQALLERLEEVSQIITSHAKFEKSPFIDAMLTLDEEELKNLDQALEWVEKEGIMARFDLETLDPTKDARIKDRLAYQLFGKRKLINLCRTAATIIKKMLGGIRLKEFPHYEPGELLDYLTASGFFAVEPTNPPRLLELDIFTANVLILKAALELKIIERFQSNTRLRLPVGKKISWYERQLIHVLAPETEDILKSECEDKHAAT